MDTPGRRIAPTRVYAYLKDNYPPSVLQWVKNEHWGIRSVVLTKIKMARRPGGRDLAKVERIADAVRNNEKMDPVVLVQTSEGYKIADGYHRTLAYKRVGKKSINAYVALGVHDEGPWDSAMHDAKLNKSVGAPFLIPVQKSLSDAELESRELLEGMSALVHDQWWDFAERVKNEVNPERAAAWETMFVPYEELPETEKEKDRTFAKRIVFLLQNPNAALSKSWGDAGVPPIANAPHHTQHPSRQVDQWAGETSAIGHVSVLDVYHRVMGPQARNEVRVRPLDHSDTGALYEVSDGRVSMRIYQPRQGIARLVGSAVKKSLQSSAPTAYAVWQALRMAGHEVRPKGSKARVDGCTVTVRGDTVVVDGAREQQVMRDITTGLHQMITTEAWVGGHMQLGQPSMTVKPW